MDETQSETPDPRSNYSVKEQIRDYWTRRSQTFDLSPAHGIQSPGELAAWKRLIGETAPGIRRARVLELACGTGEFTRVLLALGCRVEGLDLSEAMIARARAKHGDAVRLRQGDAENTMMPDAAYDAVICRHLVWTLVDPMAAFRDWMRVLAPGGRLVIVDGNWSHSDRLGRLATRLSKLWDRLSPQPPLHDAEAHGLIEQHLYFRGGLRAEDLAAMLAKAGFGDIRILPPGGILPAQLRAASWRDRLHLLQSSGRGFVVAARRPHPDHEGK